MAIWPIRSEGEWNRADAVYHRSNKGGGYWETKKPVKENWTIGYRDLRFKISPTGFKHPVRILNLFAYTGGATMAASRAGADEVVHVDASKGIVAWAKENMHINHLEDHTIRFIVDDVLKFVKREIRRGRKYDGIIMDPPSYGRGPNQELWKLEDQLYELVSECARLLSDDPLFFLVNCYTTGFPLSAMKETLTRVLVDTRGGSVEVGENLLPVTKGGVLPCGIFGRWTPKQ